MTQTALERRRHPRILPVEPFAVTVAPTAADAAISLRFGRLADASAGGLAFLTEDDFNSDEQVLVDVRSLAGDSLLERLVMRVVSSGGSPHDTLVHCAFVERPEASWLERLAREADAGAPEAGIPPDVLVLDRAWPTDSTAGTERDARAIAGSGP